MLAQQMFSNPVKLLANAPLAEFMSYAIPGLIYFVNNNILFYILQEVDPTTFQLLSQMKTIFTGLLFRVFLKRHISPVQARQPHHSPGPGLCTHPCLGVRALAWPSRASVLPSPAGFPLPTWISLTTLRTLPPVPAVLGSCDSGMRHSVLTAAVGSGAFSDAFANTACGSRGGSAHIHPAPGRRPLALFVAPHFPHPHTLPPDAHLGCRASPCRCIFLPDGLRRKRPVRCSTRFRR